ncbi:MAG: hypothetical protein LBK75_01405 [Oscillospiraceae bacterium]|jgi:hypothetical protein|nr:hypothetical protein [Oscillospiraceae bacterium]
MDNKNSLTGDEETPLVQREAELAAREKALAERERAVRRRLRDNLYARINVSVRTMNIVIGIVCAALIVAIAIGIFLKS